MSVTDSGPGLQIPEGTADIARRKGLRRMRTLAVSLLALAAVVYVLTRGETGFWGYVNAGSEAAMVGAIADWFAVTALFKHPLGLPIPHTAIIPKRKEALGESLQEFVTENFLREDIVKERILSARVSARVGAWLSDPAHARRIVAEGSRITSDVLVKVREDDVRALVEEAVIPRLLEEPLSPVVGQLLGEVLRDGAHVGLVDLVLGELGDWLVRNTDEVTELVYDRAPWWTPQWVDEKVARRIHAEAVAWVNDVRHDRQHRARLALDHWLAELAFSLEHDQQTQERAENLKQRLLTQPQVAKTSVALWEALRRAFVSALADDNGLLRRRAEEEILALGERLQHDEMLSARADGFLADAAGYSVNRYGSEIATIISATVNRWDGKETARRIELHVGRDLQFIRINGTVVGGLAGVVIHAISGWL